MKAVIADAYEQVCCDPCLAVTMSSMQNAWWLVGVHRDWCPCDVQLSADVALSSPNAMTQGKMIAVLPFVGKILEATKDSKSYRPSNPWVMGIMALLAEIYALDRLKLNLKFEIEMVFRNLGLQVRIRCYGI